MTNLQTRTVSAAFLAIAVLVLTWFGGLPFRLLGIAGAAIIYYEWVAMARPAPANWTVGAIALAFVLAALGASLPALTLMILLAVCFVISLAVCWWRGREPMAAAGLAYAALAALSLALLRGDDMAGLRAVLFLFAVVWGTDIAAYFTGRTFGGPKLAPSISPGKTWSGAMGGVVVGAMAGLAAAAAAGISITAMLIVTALLLTIVSQAGDLFESAIKRRFGVKDSSHIIPGHGGVMDRVDGLVAAGFALYVIGAALAGLDQPAHGLFGP